jgi:hypothetical protein
VTGATGSCRSARQGSSQLLIRNAFENDQENYLALLLTNPGESAIESAHRQSPCRIGLRLSRMAAYRGATGIVDLGGSAFANAAPDEVCILVMHDGEEPSAEVAALPPEMLLRDGAHEGILDEVVSPGDVAGQRASIAPQSRDFLFRAVPRDRSSLPLCSEKKVRDELSAQAQSRLR